MPFSLEVALGYLRSRPSKLVSSVSLLSIGGIALGVAALVVAMGLLSGYRSEIQGKLIGANAEVVVFPLSLPSGGYPDIRPLQARLTQIPRVKAVAAVIYQTGVELARRLDAREGDTIALSVPDRATGAARFAPRTGRFRIGRVFKTNFAEYDAEWVFLHREALRRLCRLEAEADVVEIKL